MWKKKKKDAPSSYYCQLSFEKYPMPRLKLPYFALHNFYSPTFTLHLEMTPCNNDNAHSVTFRCMRCIRDWPTYYHLTMTSDNDIISRPTVMPQ